MSDRHSNTNNNSIPNFVIHELKEDYEVIDDDDDDDCVIVKEETNSMAKSKGKHKMEQIFLDECPKPKLEKEYNGTPTSLKNSPINIIIDDDDNDNDEEVKIINVTPRPSSRPSPLSYSCSSGKRKRLSFSEPSIYEVGESSRTKKLEEKIDIINVIEDDDNIEDVTFVCDICADSKLQLEAFWIKGCSHYYCSDCVSTYVASKLGDGVLQVKCPVPNCSGTLDPEHCCDLLTREAFVRWGRLLCESSIVASHKYYCPFKDCSALLVDDGCEKVTKAKCPSCFRLFCAQCRIGWHEGIECAKYNSLSKDEREAKDIMLMNLATSNNWKRCPKCNIFVERTMGCNNMLCSHGMEVARKS